MLGLTSVIGIDKGYSEGAVVIGLKSDASPLPRCFGFSVFSVIATLLPNFTFYFYLVYRVLLHPTDSVPYYDISVLVAIILQCSQVKFDGFEKKCFT
jgi:hypothetical protein